MGRKKPSGETGTATKAAHSRPAQLPVPTETVSLSSLTLDPANVRQHPERNRVATEASLKRFGAARSIVVDGKGVVRAGNGTVEAARAAGIDKAIVVDADGDQLVVVRRKDWSPSEATAYAIADNRVAEHATWEETGLAEVLRSLQSEDFDLGAVGYTSEEVDSLIAGLGNGLLDGVGEPAEDSDTPPDGFKVFPDDQVVEVAFRWFRETGFPYRDLPVWECMRQINRLHCTSAETLLQTVTAYQVPDTYHRHRFHAAAEGMRSPFDAFSDDDALRKAIRLALEHNKDVETVLWVVNGTQACANFRPGFACKLYRDYCKPGDTVLDASTGYGGRLVGFMASGIAGRYIGIDPNIPTHEANVRMSADLGFAEKVELYNLPAEDVPHDLVAGRCDFAFTSPPYFRKEHYSNDPTQSWVRYSTAEAWRDGFLRPMLALQFVALKSGCYAVVNIADVKIKGTIYPLVGWTIQMGEAAGFEHIRTDKFELQRRFGAGNSDEVAFEPVIVFRKPAAT